MPIATKEPITPRTRSARAISGVPARTNGSRLPSGVSRRSDQLPAITGIQSAIIPSPAIKRPMTTVELVSGCATTGR
jgi:hypothetical protein